MDSARKPPRRGAASVRRVQDWTAGYEALPGIHDEFLDANGAPRAHWLRFLGALSRMEDEQIDSRFAAADRHIRDLGVSYRVYGETNERSWPLSHVPLLIPEHEWRDIAAGVTQRAELMEKILSDLYGDATLVSEGALPAAAVTGSADFMRPMKGVKPPGGRWLRLYAADIGRGPDGKWWVLNDRAQAPSGSGYALENRLVLSRAFPNLYREMNVERLAPFFREFRRGLTSSAQRMEPRICLLTPGPYSQTYFEQAYLARYLGILLVEGDDLVVQDGQVHVRTIAGLKRADVIWRRVDADWCDPLEANSSSRLGVPGLMQAIRNGAVTVANMPGTGLVESRALLGFMPALCRRLMGEDLRLPNVATWWCGQAAERDDVLERLDKLAISGAFTDLAMRSDGRKTLLGADLDEDARRRLRETIELRGIDYVGQEVVELSTTPVWENGRLSPRPFVLRVFAAATEDGWQVLPGGFCRVSESGDTRAVSMGEGVQSADVWVLADKPVEMSTLLPSTDSVKIRRLLGNLPSRAADNLFWLGRYLERAEATLRLVRCLCSRVMDPDSASGGSRQSIERLERLLIGWGAVSDEVEDGTTAEIAAAALHELAHHGSAIALANASRRAASVIRERLSPDAWQLLNALETNLSSKAPKPISETEAFDHADSALRIIAALSGLVQENVNRVAGWRFLDMGRRVERGINTCRFARQFADKDATADNLDVLLDLIDSQITYRSRYLVGVALAPVRDMVLLDTFNPRSVGFQAERIEEHLATLPLLREDGILETPRRLSVKLVSDLSVEDAEQIDPAKILAFEQRLMSLAEAIAERYFLQGPGSGRADRLMDLA
ncbi:MAG: circularly permuted type 2 ATP-grasp protein [Beijerinckiaceae bacterium]|nr:circularly permuted type 2 ATP-grasp protein [Beijerinckiaceae bacterium]MDO9441979.1 circularly permuted type 2 ATP-grasp protein [Beijerinckiaceae bacterium]